MHVVAAIVAALVLALAAAGPAAAAGRYVVAPHDTLFSIARRFRVPLPILAHVNGIHDPSRIRVGDVLVIPNVPAGAAAAAAATTAAPRTSLSSRQGPSGQVPLAMPAASGDSYIVRPGDTLYRLALTHGTTVEALQEANGLTSPAILVGQVIRVPRFAPLAPAPLTPTPVIPRVDVTPPDVTAPGGATPPSEPAFRPVEPARAALLAHVRASALGYLGTPYVWGGTTPSGVDCSGLVHLVYSPYVANLPRTSYDQWTAGVAVDRVDLAPGDLVFFNTDGTGASHVGIYIGDGQFVHPAATAQRVIVDRLDASYYATHYLGARRVL